MMAGTLTLFPPYYSLVPESLGIWCPFIRLHGLFKNNFYDIITQERKSGRNYVYNNNDTFTQCAYSRA